MRSASSLPRCCAASLPRRSAPRVLGRKATAKAAAAGSACLLAGTGASGSWWPRELGAPASTGAQNDMRYAWFPGSEGLRSMRAARSASMTSGEHRISGFSQQQGGDRSLTFTSQYGVVRLSELALVSPRGDVRSKDAVAGGESAPQRPAPPASTGETSPSPPPRDGGHRQDDRAACGVASEKHSHRRRIFGEEGGAPQSALGAPSLTPSAAW